MFRSLLLFILSSKWVIGLEKVDYMLKAEKLDGENFDHSINNSLFFYVVGIKYNYKSKVSQEDPKSWQNVKNDKLKLIYMSMYNKKNQFF